jgi:hypothetical protein
MSRNPLTRCFHSSAFSVSSAILPSVCRSTLIPVVYVEIWPDSPGAGCSSTSRLTTFETLDTMLTARI